MNRLGAVVAGALCLLFAGHAIAASVTFSLTGSVTFVDDDLLGNFAVGEAVSTTLTYESSTLGSNCGVGCAIYLDAISSGSFTIGSFTASLAPPITAPDNEINVTDSTGFDRLRFIYRFGPSLPGFDPFRFDFSLLDITGDTLSTSIPLPSQFDTSTWTGGGFSLGFKPSGTSNLSRVRGDFELSVIPVPAALPMLLTGLFGLGVIGWRRRKAA